MPATGAMVELLLGSTWTDVTSDVYLRDRIRITRGRQDQGSRVDPGSCAFTLNNKGGVFSPRNPMSPYFGLIGRNTPVRVSATGGVPWLGSPADPTPRQRASTPDASALDITGDLDIRFDVQPEDWNSTGVFELGGKRGASGQYGWRAFLFKGLFYLEWSADGTTELTVTAPLTSSALQPRLTLRAALDVNNGASGNTVRFYVGPSLSGPWTQLGTDQVTPGVTSIFNNTAPLEIGDITSTVFVTPNVGGQIYAAQIRNGIDGAIVASPDFTAQAAGATAFTDSTGRAWTVTAGGITNRRIRFLGEISSWPSRWDVSGGDVYVPVQASGILRRLGQGASPLDSTLRRRIPADPSVIAYWPMEDGRDAAQAYSPIPGVAPMRTSGLSFGADDSLAGSSALPTVGSSGARLNSAVPSYTSTGAWCIELVYNIPTGIAADANQQFLVFSTTGGLSWRAGIGAATIHLDVTDSDGVSKLSTNITSGFGVSAVGQWSRFFVEAQQSGSNVAVTFGCVNIGGSNTIGTGSFAGQMSTLSSVNSAIPSSLSGTAFGHIAAFNMFEPVAFNNADTGFATEDAAARYSRLCTEEGIPFRVPYGIAGTALVGPQRPDALLNLLEEAQDADVGVLYEAREAIALAYRPRVSLYNQTPALALDYTVRGEVAPPLEPVEDDTQTRNDITISRPSGSSARATLDTGALSTQTPPLGVGRYATSETRNVQTDAQLPDLASWLLHLGTWDEARYPQVTVNLAAGPWLTEDACTVDIGDLITISNPPPWLPPGDIVLMAQGYTETIGVYEWTITYNCTPGQPWTVGVIGDTVLGKADTSGSTLNAGVTATATTLSVASTGARWTTDPTEYPMDLLLGGEVVTATACTGTSSPQSMTVARGTNGVARAWDAGTQVRLAYPMTLAL